MTPLSLKNMSRIWGYEKIKDAYSKKVCMSKKREIAPDPKRKERKERDGTYKEVHTPSTKNIHTLAHLDQGL